MGKNLDNFKDQLGFIGHLDPNNVPHLEFGDACQRLGTSYISRFITEPMTQRFQTAQEFAEQLHSIFKDDEPVRYPDSQKWYGRPGTMSRDNFEPILQSMVLYQKYSEPIEHYVKYYIKKLWQRGGFFWNTKHIWENSGWKVPDWYGPDIVPMTIKALDIWWAYPVILAFDLFKIISVFIRCLVALFKKESTSDDLNLINRLAFGQMIYFSPIVWWTACLYVALRPRASVSAASKRKKGYGPTTAIDCYFDNPYAPPMLVMYGPIIDKYV